MKIIKPPPRVLSLKKSSLKPIFSEKIRNIYKDHISLCIIVQK